MMIAQPRLLGLVCGTVAAVLGFAYMAAAGAPSRYLLVNLAALVVGATAWLALDRASDDRTAGDRAAAGRRFIGAGPAVLALAAPLLLTALFGVAVDGASRWVSVGPLSLQVSLMVLPVMIVLYARVPDAIGTVGLVVAALALALQPDRAMAGVLAAALLFLMVAEPSRLVITAAAAAILAFGWTLFSPDTLSAVPYVDRILYTAFDVHPLAGLGVVVGCAALVMPAMIGATRQVKPGEANPRPVLFAFAGCWSGVVAAAAIGNYPTPLVGYGGSAVLGYLLSVAMLPGRRELGHGGAVGSDIDAGEDPDRTILERRAATAG